MPKPLPTAFVTIEDVIRNSADSAMRTPILAVPLFLLGPAASLIAARGYTVLPLLGKEWLEIEGTSSIVLESVCVIMMLPAFFLSLHLWAFALRFEKGADSLTGKARGWRRAILLSAIFGIPSLGLCGTIAPFLTAALDRHST